MEIKSFETIMTELNEQKAKISATAGRLRTQLAELEEDLARIDAGLAIFSGAPLPVTKGAVSKKERKKVAVPAANKTQVIEIMTSELTQAKSLQPTDLKSLVESRLVESGYSRMGLSLRFKEALSDSRFQNGLNGVSLKQSTLSSQRVTQD
jgi:hypothetical protein